MYQRVRPLPLVFVCLLACLLCWPGAAGAARRTIQLPITLDYPFLRALFVSQAYRQPGPSAVVVDQDQGCTKVVLSRPRLGVRGALLEITNHITIKGGVKVLGKCLDPVEWQGRSVVLQEVRLDKDAWRVRLKTVSSKLLDADGKPAPVAGALYSLARERVHEFLDQLTVNLAPPRDDLTIQLPLLVNESMRPRLEQWLATLRPADLVVTDEAVRVTLAMEVDLPPTPAPPPARQAPPTPKEVEAFTRYWEAWDSYLVQQILTLADAPLTEAERTELLAIVLEARYGFVGALESGDDDPALVRRQFLAAWGRLGPILRRRLATGDGAALMNYLAYFSAGDALAVLDRLGPALGLELSVPGLRRLARLVSQADYFPELAYDYAVDQRLRDLLGLGPALPAKAEARGHSWLPAWPAAAWAGERKPPVQELAPWLPPTEALHPYLGRVLEVVRRAAGQALDKGEAPRDREAFFGQLAEAAAWQESCWRQFRLANGEPVYLRSYNNTSVGLMQINERVWRGLYDLQSLRWDIAYNARAGCQILGQYLTRYALPAAPAGLPEDALAGLVYAMYNGGPSQRHKYLKRREAGRLYASDRLFAQKYAWAAADRLDEASRCLLGRPPGK